MRTALRHHRLLLGLFSLLVLAVLPLSLPNALSPSAAFRVFDGVEGRGLDAFLGHRFYRCRNGILEPGEECDDGNRENNDDCPNDCKLAVCGDSVLEGLEQCDDGNTEAGDGCGPTCTYEKRCGNGAVESGEQCDDGNLINGDGCSVGCRILSGWSCTGSPSQCAQSCGNGTVEPSIGEKCDDQNNQDGDGCSRVCTVEKGWACTLDEPSRCHCITTAKKCGLTQCGNDILNPGEECDSGILNGMPNDACNANCSLRKGFVCTGKIGERPICSHDLSVLLNTQQKFRAGVE